MKFVHFAAHAAFTPVLSYRTIPVTLELKDPQHPDQDLGTLELAVTLTPKDSPIEERRDSVVRTVLNPKLLKLLNPSAV